jgi:hypothetical protein
MAYVELYTDKIPVSDINDPLNPQAQFEKQLKIFKDDSDNIYIKPNEIIKYVKPGLIRNNEGKYKLRIHFLRNIKSTIGNYFKVMENNLIENGNFFAGLEATQAGDLDKSSGKNNFLRTYNPGYSPWVLNQNGIPGNEYVMWITGVQQNCSYVFSCWVAWDSEYNGDKHVVAFSDENNGLNIVEKTDFMGSYISELEGDLDGGRILKQKPIKGLMWYKLYAFVQTNTNFDDSLYIHLGKNAEGWQASTKPLGGRYYTDVRLEKVDSLYGEPIQAYLKKLKDEDSTINGGVYGFGDDIGFDDFDPEGGNTGGSNYEIEPENTVESGELPIADSIYNVIKLDDILSANLGDPVQSDGGGYSPGNNFGDDPGIDEVKKGGKIKIRRRK